MFKRGGSTTNQCVMWQTLQCHHPRNHDLLKVWGMVCTRVEWRIDEVREKLQAHCHGFLLRLIG